LNLNQESSSENNDEVEGEVTRTEDAERLNSDRIDRQYDEEQKEI